MKLSKREAQVLDAIAAENLTLNQIGKALTMKKPNLSRYSRKLKRLGLITISKKGRNHELGLEQSVGFGLSSIRADFPQLKLADILIGYTPSLLSFIKNKESFRVANIDLPVPTTKRILSRLRSLGIVSMPKRGVYRIRKEAEPVAEFCRNTLTMMHQAEAREEIQSLDHSLFSFDSAKELGAVFVTMRESHPKHYWPTFYGVAHNYGLQLLPSGHFYYSNSKPDIGDVIIHTLAIQKDTRGIIYASVIALKSKYDVRKLLKKRQTYNLSRDYIHRFVEFILSDGKKPFGGLDSYHELRSVGYGAV